MEKSKGKVAGFFGGIGRFFRGFGEAVAKGDLFVKLSLIWMGAGYFRRKQYVKSILITIFEALVIVFSVVCSSQYIPEIRDTRNSKKGVGIQSGDHEKRDQRL